MAVVVTQGCRPYWNYGVHDLAEGQVIPDGEFADYLLSAGAPAEVVKDDPAGGKTGRGKRPRGGTDAEGQG